jgi:hypothetical protein
MWMWIRLQAISQSGDRPAAVPLPGLADLRLRRGGPRGFRWMAVRLGFGFGAARP